MKLVSIYPRSAPVSTFFEYDSGVSELPVLRNRPWLKVVIGEYTQERSKLIGKFPFHVIRSSRLVGVEFLKVRQNIIRLNKNMWNSVLCKGWVERLPERDKSLLKTDLKSLSSAYSFCAGCNYKSMRKIGQWTKPESTWATWDEQSHLNSVNKAQWSQKWILPFLICDNFTPIAHALYLLDCEHRRISGRLLKEEYVFVCYTYPARTAKFPYEYATSKTLHHILRLKVAGYPLAKHSLEQFQFHNIVTCLLRWIVSTIEREKSGKRAVLYPNILVMPFEHSSREFPLLFWLVLPFCETHMIC